MIASTNTQPINLRRRLLDGIAFLLVAYAALNLNGVMQMLTGTEAALSPLVLAASLVVIMAFGGRDLAGPVYFAFAGFLCLYLLGALVPLVMRGTLDTGRLISYVGTLLFCSAIYFYMSRRGESALPALFASLKIMFAIDCLAALNAPALSAVFEHARVTERATGFFDNPNETAVMALYYCVLCMTAPSRSRLWTAAQIALAFVTILATFSKTGLLLFLVLAAGYLLSRRAYGWLLLAAVGVALALPVLDTLATLNPLGLSIDQRRRIEQIVRVFSGDIDDKVTTGRTVLWSLGLDRIGSTFPFGGGLGSFHGMEGGFANEDGEWLGVHNAFLMVLGESGLIPLLALFAFLAALLRSVLASPRRLMGLGLMTVLVGDMLVTHGVLAIRVHDLMLAIIMAIAFRGARPEAPSR